MINKNDFIKYIGKIKELRDIEDAINEAGSKIEFFQISFAEYEQVLVDILTDTFDDKENNWLSYFLYELNFGKDYKDGKITMNGKIVPMSNAGELYDVLIDNMKESDSI